jgi:hypothetical protein
MKPGPADGVERDLAIADHLLQGGMSAVTALRGGCGATSWRWSSSAVTTLEV